jgi:hypothetical protein
VLGFTLLCTLHCLLVSINLPPPNKGSTNTTYVFPSKLHVYRESLVSLWAAEKGSWDL